MKENEKEPVDLPENAFRELEEGEEYNPIMSPGRSIGKLLRGRFHGESSWPYFFLRRQLIWD